MASAKRERGDGRDDGRGDERREKRGDERGDERREKRGRERGEHTRIIPHDMNDAHPLSAWSVAFTEDSRQVAIGSDHGVHLYDLESEHPLRQFVPGGGANAVVAVQFFKTVPHLLAVFSTGECFVVGRFTLDVVCHTKLECELEFGGLSPTEDRILCGGTSNGDGGLEMVGEFYTLRAKDCKVLTQVETALPHIIEDDDDDDDDDELKYAEVSSTVASGAFTADGEHVIIGSTQGDLQRCTPSDEVTTRTQTVVWHRTIDFRNENRGKPFGVNHGSVRIALNAVAPGEEYVYAVSNEMTVPMRVWDTDHPAPLRSYQGTEHIRRIALFPNGRWMAGVTPNELRIVNLLDSAVVRRFNLVAEDVVAHVTDLVVSPCGNYVAIAQFTGGLRLFDLRVARDRAFRDLDGAALDAQFPGLRDLCADYITLNPRSRD